MKIQYSFEPKIWNTLLKTFSYSDYFHSFHYHEVFCKYVLKGAKPIIFYNNSFCLPLIYKKVHNTDYYDLTSVYGYNGILIKDDQNIETILENLIEFIGNHFTEIVTIFFRSYPFQKIVSEKYIQKNNILALIDLLDEKWPINLKQNEKRNILKLKKNGAEVSAKKGIFEINSFFNNYYDTMNRNKAENFYYFDESFIKEVLLGYNAKLYSVILNDKIISSAIFLVNKKVTHYYLGGSDSNYLKYSPLKLIIFEAFFNLKNVTEYINLGSGNESLRHFKIKMSNKNDDFYLIKHTFNKNIYKKLVRDFGSKDNFFPEYW